MTTDLRKRIQMLLRRMLSDSRRMLSDSRCVTSTLIELTLSLPDLSDRATLEVLDRLGGVFHVSHDDRRTMWDLAQELRAELEVPA